MSVSTLSWTSSGCFLSVKIQVLLFDFFDLLRDRSSWLALQFFALCPFFLHLKHLPPFTPVPSPLGHSFDLGLLLRYQWPYSLQMKHWSFDEGLRGVRFRLLLRLRLRERLLLRLLERDLLLARSTTMCLPKSLCLHHAERTRPGLPLS